MWRLKLSGAGDLGAEWWLFGDLEMGVRLLFRMKVRI